MIIIVIIIISCIIFLLGYKNKDNTENIIVEGNPGENVEINIDKMEDVIDRGRFFTVEKCVQQYLDEINNNNARYLEEMKIIIKRK